MKVWPADLPLPQFGSEFSPVDPQIRTPLESGRTFSRRKFTAVPVNFPATFIAKTDEQAARFESYYKDDLADGTEWFLMPLLLPQGRGGYRVRFMGIYAGPERVNAPGMLAGAWRYRANLQMFLRPADTAPVDLNEYRVTEDGEFRILE